MDLIRKITRAFGQLKREDSGYSLLELMIAMTLAIVLLSSLFILYYGATSAAAKEELRGQAHKESRLVTKRLARDLRMVGLMAPLDINGDANDIKRDVPGQAWSDSLRSDFERANTYDLIFTSDIDNDGRTETVRYFLENRQIKEKTWKWSRDSLRWLVPQTRVIANNVDFLMFGYYDRDGNTIPDIVTYPHGGYTLGMGERTRVTAVEVTVVIRSDRRENSRPSYMHMPDGTYWYDKYDRVEDRFLIRGRNLRLNS
jgi:type II secretory pathway pseudopilin PulG